MKGETEAVGRANGPLKGAQGNKFFFFVATAGLVQGKHSLAQPRRAPVSYVMVLGNPKSGFLWDSSEINHHALTTCLKVCNK